MNARAVPTAKRHATGISLLTLAIKNVDVAVEDVFKDCEKAGLKTRERRFDPA